MQLFRNARFCGSRALFGLSVTLSLVPASPAHGVGLFRCVDADGQVTFSQTACSSGRVERVQVEVQNRGWIKQTSKKRAKRPSRDREPAVQEAQVNRAQRERCWRAEKRIDRIQQRLRQGYRRAEGERLRRERREQEEYLSRFCP